MLAEVAEIVEEDNDSSLVLGSGKTCQRPLAYVNKLKKNRLLSKLPSAFSESVLVASIISSIQCFSTLLMTFFCLLFFCGSPLLGTLFHVSENLDLNLSRGEYDCGCERCSRQTC